jgi:hypothetical protein
MKQSPKSGEAAQSSASLAMLVIGISLNSLGVVLIALRGIAWIGMLLMVVGIGLLLASAVRLSAETRRSRAETD